MKKVEEKLREQHVGIRDKKRKRRILAVMSRELWREERYRGIVGSFRFYIFREQLLYHIFKKIYTKDLYYLAKFVSLSLFFICIFTYFFNLNLLG